MFTRLGRMFVVAQVLAQISDALSIVLPLTRVVHHTVMGFEVTHGRLFQHVFRGSVAVVELEEELHSQHQAVKNMHSKDTFHKGPRMGAWFVRTAVPRSW